MRRTVLSTMALVCTAVLAGAAPALADEGRPAEQAPTAAPAEQSAKPSADRAEQSAKPGAARAEQSAAPEDARPTPRDERAAEPAEKREPGQVPVVPKGAPDTGVTTSSSESGSNDSALIGGAAAAVLLAGGATTFVVRRRRATGA